jgi:hypothetical protein
MVVPEIPVSLTANEKLELVWLHVQVNEDTTSSDSARNNGDKRKWPSYNDVLQDLRKSDYNELLTCPLDLHPGRPVKRKPKVELKLPRSLSLLKQSSQEPQEANQCPVLMSRQKTICAQGVVCSARLELFPFPGDMKGRPYSGLLTPGTTVEHCLVRLSSALQPMDMGKNKRIAKAVFGDKLTSAKIFPGVAVKLFRSHQNSGNMLFLGSKVGQSEDEFFAHCLSTQVTTRMPVTMKPILQVFKRYSELPTALGLSDMCTYGANGEMANDLNFPYCLTLLPRVRTKVRGGRRLEDEDSDMLEPLDSFLDDMLNIPAGTVLYDLFASPDPLSVTNVKKLQRIGRLVSTSTMQMSPQDDGLFFRHQKKDEDFALRPEWKEDLDTKVVLKDGSKGTAASLAGWELFEHLIHQGGYVDFELSNK